MIHFINISPPVSYGDLRNLSLTEFLSKSFERFILKGTNNVKGLLHYISKYFDPAQYALPGASCNHALISSIDFILKSTDDPNKPTAVINLLADWSKAFNNHHENPNGNAGPTVDTEADPKLPPEQKDDP